MLFVGVRFFSHSLITKRKKPAYLRCSEKEAWRVLLRLKLALVDVAVNIWVLGNLNGSGSFEIRLFRNMSFVVFPE